MLLEILIFLITTIVIYYWYRYKQLHSFFESKNVKFLPGIPVFGNCLESTLQKKHMWHDLDRVYKTFPNERYVGFVERMKPHILIRDPELIKMITVKDFDHFVDHKEFFSENLSPLFAGSLLAMKGERWRNMRTTLSPAFTSSKMKFMVQFITDICNNIVEYLKEHTLEDIGVDDLIRRYTTDVIASASFGLEVNSLKERNNEFFKIGQTLFNFNSFELVKMFIDEQFPSISKKLDLKLYPGSTYKFFTKIVSDTIEHRKKYKLQRPDMIQLMMETPREWSLHELTSQAFVFFAAGFETSASALTMTIHELAVNPDIQEKLYQEIRAFKETGGEVTHDNVISLNYLDCVVKETLRKWSPAIIVDRVCVKSYELPPAREGGKPYILNPGDPVYNSCNSLHMDPQYFPDPEKFDPDRFSEENKHNINPFTYMPFGVGPRVCIGSRFAILEVKILMYYLVLNFKIQKCAKTAFPIELVNYGFGISAVGGTSVRFEPR